MISKRFAPLTGQKKIVLYLLALLCWAPLPAMGQVSFSTQAYPVAEPSQVATGDFNGDGKPDVAVLSLVGGTVSILLNNGDGTFAPAVDFPALTPQGEGVPWIFYGIAVGDMNGDNRPDLVVGKPGAFPSNNVGGSVNVLLGNGDGTFQRPIITDASIGPRIGNLGDFNGDKKLDTILSGPCCVALTPLLGNGDGTFHNGTEMSSGISGSFGPIILVDSNQDGKLDVVVPPGFVFLGKGDGTFQSPLQVSLQAPNVLFLRTGDFNHDGKPDLLSSSVQGYSCPFGACTPIGPPGSVAVMLGNGDGTFGGPGVITNGNFGFPVVGDFDGDGNPDVAADGVSLISHFWQGSEAFYFYLGNGQGGFAAPAAVTLAAVAFRALSLAPADFNGDGLADLVLISGSDVQVALNTTPGFSLESSPPGPPVPPGGSAAYTINVGQQNGFSDMVTLACSSPVSQGVHCSLSQASVAPGSSSTLTVTTTAAGSGLNGTSGPGSGLFYALWLPIAGLVSGGIGFGFKQSRKAKLRTLMLGCVLGAGLVFLVACGGGSSNSSAGSGGSGSSGGGTPAGTYSIVVTGTSGAMQRSTTVTLKVQ